ncbi:MAG: HAD family hydrolase [Lachnospiraceae bacterium]|nr:HAD family hydrolase [Lachnospiraceae bacterium]
MKADAVLLDVDGTIWDTTPLVAEAWSKALAAEGYERRVTAEELKGLFGKPMNVIADEMLPELTAEERYRLMDVCTEYEEKALEENERDISYPGVVATIKKLSEKIPVCIVSNCQSGYIELAMDKLGITEYIADTECYGDTGKYKAENIRLVMERNGFRKPVYVGDILGDEEAAHAAGIAFIHAAYGFGSAKEPEAVIGSFPELLETVSLLP